MTFGLLGEGNQMSALAKNMIRFKTKPTIPINRLGATPNVDPTAESIQMIHRTVERIAPTAQLNNRRPSLDDIPLTEEEKRELVLRQFRDQRKPKSKSGVRKKKKR